MQISLESIVIGNIFMLIFLAISANSQTFDCSGNELYVFAFDLKNSQKVKNFTKKINRPSDFYILQTPKASIIQIFL